MIRLTTAAMVARQVSWGSYNFGPIIASRDVEISSGAKPVNFDPQNAVDRSCKHEKCTGHLILSDGSVLPGAMWTQAFGYRYNVEHTVICSVGYFEHHEVYRYNPGQSNEYIGLETHLIMREVPGQSSMTSRLYECTRDPGNGVPTTFTTTAYFTPCSGDNHDLERVAHEAVRTAQSRISSSPTTITDSALMAQAVESFNPMGVNTIANMLEIADGIKKVPAILSSLKSLVSELLKYTNPADAWLAYRYAIMTTLSDVRAIMTSLDDALARAAALYTGEWQRAYATEHETVGSVSITRTLKILLASDIDNAIQQLWLMLHPLGLQINFATIWDIIPLSFVIDWFVSIGDYLETIDKQLMFNETHFNFGSCTSSVKAVTTVETAYGYITYTSYVRQVLTEIPQIGHISHDPSDRTKIKRTIDGAALIIGGRS